MPAWVPGLAPMSIARALETGLTFRALETTARETLEWALAAGKALPLKAGLSLQREAEVLRAWQAR